MISTVRIGRFLTRAEAAVARGLLETHGIEAHVLGDDGGGVQPDISYGYGGVALAVHPDDEADARALLADVDAPLARDDLRTPGWRATSVLVVAAAMLVVLVATLILDGSILTLR